LADLVFCLVYFVGIESCRLAFDNPICVNLLLRKIGTPCHLYNATCRHLNQTITAYATNVLLADLVFCLVYFVGIESCRLAFDNALWLGNILGKSFATENRNPMPPI
jgi:hypothetical protein